MFSSNANQASNPLYIEDVFSTYLYTGTGASLTITNNIDTTTYGGLTWIKSRSAATDHKLTDTARGVTKALISDTGGAQTTDTTGLTAFGTTGFTIGADANYNTSSATYASWTFRKQAKFFDVVTYTGTGSVTTIAHALGSVPGCMIIKSTSSASWNWIVYHQALGITQKMQLNLTDEAIAENGNFGGTAPTSTNFSVGYNATNESGGTYVAYLFAHNAGGFGLTGTDNVISCGSYTQGSGDTAITLGYEPQWVMIKSSDATGSSWAITDNMRAMPVSGSASRVLNANLSNSESSSIYGVHATSTGFISNGFTSGAFIYIAIRRGPMKVPTLGTSVFTPITANAVAGTTQTTNFVIDSQWKAIRAGDSLNTSVDDRLRGISTTATASGNYLITSSLVAESTTNATTQAWNNIGFQISTYYASLSTIFYNFSRAPSFFDEVCYTGTGSSTTQTHNLGAVPELIIVKGCSGATAWQVYSSALANTEYVVLNTTAAKATGATRWNATTPTSTVFSLGTNTGVNASGVTYVAYLFATCAGVSKVGSYTGTGATQTIACGFGASGARFVLIKRTDTTGDWYVWDTARGMISGTDPSLLLNSTAAEVNANSIYAISTGFQIVSTAAGINASAGSYIFLSIA